ncbi:MAG: hypothetical protein EOM87_05750, partial [Clostridia bacterium]|nr:hypothetical protein [Clostridia bacterium]
MKKLLNVKGIIVLIALVMLLTLVVGCDTDIIEKKTVQLPDFSVSFIDGETTIVVTDEMLSAVTLSEFSIVKSDVTSYYKGFKVSDMVAAITGLDVSGIESLLVIANDGYGNDKPALPEANFDNAYFALFIKDAEGVYGFLDADNGPVRLFDTT